MRPTRRCGRRGDRGRRRGRDPDRPGDAHGASRRFPRYLFKLRVWPGRSWGVIVNLLWPASCCRTDRPVEWSWWAPPGSARRGWQQRSPEAPHRATVRSSGCEQRARRRRSRSGRSRHWCPPRRTALQRAAPSCSSRARHALAERTGGRRLVLCVDDGQLLDDASAALLHQLVAAREAFAVVDRPAGRAGAGCTAGAVEGRAVLPARARRPRSR